MDNGDEMDKLVGRLKEIKITKKRSSDDNEKLKDEILNELSKQILADTVNKDKEIVVDVVDKKFVFLNK